MAETLRSFYTYFENTDLKNGSSGPVFGKSVARYEIYRRIDVTNLNSVLGYMILMQQRIIIPNNSPPAPGPTSSSSYENYPAILLNEIKIGTNNNATVLLKKIFPRTLNSSVSTSTSSSSGNTRSTTHENSSGSSNTNVNTFGVNVNAGFFGELPVGGISLDYSHSWEDSKFKSAASGTGQSAATETGASDSMRVKNWSSYGYPDKDSVAPTWVWGQSYPWDVILFNQSSDGSNIDLPGFVVDRMLNGKLVMPPSQLSLFGLDFTMQAVWLVDYPDGITADETITISHTTSSYTASHRASGDSIAATLQSASNANQAQYNTGALVLSQLALNPISKDDAGNGAAIGFLANSFTYPPTASTANFKIVSPANNVQVDGNGFDAIMTTSFKTNPVLNVTFKIADTSVEYSLYLMHWINASGGPCTIKWTVNEKWNGYLYIDSLEGEGGQNNVSSIDLRNKDFTSINFHDYLLVGTNRVQMVIEPVNAQQSNSYTLFALAIGQS
ncbi:MAG: hypothetical protein KDK34_02600 [Leptospiraceae bacterium]|nr:hypothetical protein [Leptospiraceae bacterium]